MVQIFDSWASELAPQDFDIFSAPYIHRITKSVCPPELAMMEPADRGSCGREMQSGAQLQRIMSHLGCLLSRSA